MSDRAVAWWVRGALALPFAVALIKLATVHWSPVLDLAMTELRVRDVLGRHTPLIGLPGRIGTFPDQGSHPGPLSFYLLAPVYRLLGSTSYALLVSATVVNVGAGWVAITLTARRGGRRLIIGVGALLLALSAWFGASLLTQPWNPYLPLVSFVVVLLATWSIIEGDHLLLIPLVFFASLCAQTHVPYLSLSLAMCAVAFGAVVWRWWKAHAIDAAPRRSVALAVGLGALLWLPVFVDQFRHSPGNITMLRRHFLSPPEKPVGWAQGLRTVLAHFDVTRVASGAIGRNGSALDRLSRLTAGRWAVGAVVVVIWAVAVIVARRLADRRIVHLHAVAVIGVAVGLISTARIFGKIWYYLTLWSWSLCALAVAATVWTFIASWERSGHRRIPVVHIGAALFVLAGGALLQDAVTVNPPEARLSRVLNAVVGPTAEALADGVGAANGRDGVYVVVWNDAYYFGSQGYGLINELERRGFTVRAYETFRVPVTPQRIVDSSHATAEVVLATGINVDKWRSREGVVEVAFFEPRSTAELAEFDDLRGDAISRLRTTGFDDLVELVDSNLFGASVDPRLPSAVESMLTRMLQLGEETAIFIAPAGTF